ncbi:MAG: 3-hydroxyacyl-CoA dehydrogenase/enoyl-CoA hydratase/3-hydroxybutyryl-CoA epimerase [Planctomycetota bacterium]|jgi:3-hydroxyacyl-CoA dehydrogenase/enoyl-CoA hydratase/3-hydroxybutyryl-CoA epimerase
MSTIDKQAIEAAKATPAAAMPKIELHDVVLTIADGYATLRLGRPDESMVTLTESRIEQIEAAISTLATTAELRGVIVTGPGPGMFCAGADVNLIRDITVAADGEAAAVRGRSVFGKLQDLKVPVVAAIEGPCLGGGFELALFCDVRIASNAKTTQIGLPEVKLGIVPGFGGTQNLTRLVGLPKALELILNGKLMRGKQALRARIIDRLVPATKLLTAAREEIDKLSQKQSKSKVRKLRGMAWWLSHTPLRAIAVRAANKALNKGQARFYPAPKRALQCCVNALRLQPKDGFAQEAKALGDMIVTTVSKGLVHLFFLTERQKRLGKHEHAKNLSRAVVIGGGVMGAGIASQFATKGMPTRLCDVALAPLAAAKARLQKGLNKLLKRRRIQPHEATATQDRLAVSTSPGHLRDTDLWIEAVVENLAVKQKIMSDAIAQGLPDDAIIATNTSSLSVTAMQEQVAHPERVVGIHFFNPPEKMPLVEVIRGKHTSDGVVASACRLALRLGKFPIVVEDSPGFLVNRCLSPYINEAARMLLEGTSPEAIDSAMLDFGMPMGPCRLLDEVGFDVADKVSEVMQQAFPDRMQPCELFAAMVEANALGQKTGGGIYGKAGLGKGPGRSVVEKLREQRGTPARAASRSELLHRLIYPLVDEAYRCLEEGLVKDEQDLDLGLVMGIGFPPFTGGITRFAESEGMATIVSKLDELSRSLDGRFNPCDGLRRRALVN